MTQSTDVFKTISAEEAQAFFGEMRDELRPVYKQAERVAAATLRLRPVFLGKQPFPKRCDMIRKALALRPNADASAELLATFFLERYSKDVAELLDLFGIEHEDGVLKDQAPKAPTKAKMKKAVQEFPTGDHALMRGILLKAFAAQSAIDWTDLDAMLFDVEVAK